MHMRKNDMKEDIRCQTLIIETAFKVGEARMVASALTEPAEADSEAYFDAVDKYDEYMEQLEEACLQYWLTRNKVGWSSG